MPPLQTMPTAVADPTELSAFGAQWIANGEKLSRSQPYSSIQLGDFFDQTIAAPLATMLGGIPVLAPINRNALLPPQPDCVEAGEVRIIGGVRPQNFDVGYRPDGVRFAFDSKTLNDGDSIRKNYQNMINDLATEATTIHSRFPSALACFLVAVPQPALHQPQADALVGTLERLSGRVGVEEPEHMAEAIAFCVWDPTTGQLDNTVMDPGSPLRLDRFSEQVEARYRERFKGLPPHSA